MGIDEKLEEIDTHFKNISDDEFKEALMRSGQGEIKALSDSNLRFADVIKD